MTFATPSSPNTLDKKLAMAAAACSERVQSVFRVCACRDELLSYTCRCPPPAGDAQHRWRPAQESGVAAEPTCHAGVRAEMLCESGNYTRCVFLLFWLPGYDVSVLVKVRRVSHYMLIRTEVRLFPPSEGILKRLHESPGLSYKREMFSWTSELDS